MRPFYRHDITINGENLREDYGVTAAPGSLAQLLALPRFKSGSIKTIDWQESNGIEADLSGAVFEPARAVIRLQATGGKRIGEIAEDVMTPGHLFSMEIENTGAATIWGSCRLVSMGNYRPELGIETADFTIEGNVDIHDFLETYLYDNPGDAEYTPQSSSVPLTAQPVISVTGPANWQYISSLGVRVLKGWNAGLTQIYEAKQPLVRNISDEEGVIFDNDSETVAVKRGTLTLQMLLHCGDNLTDFWKRYWCLLYWLTKPGPVTLTATGYGTFTCYYDSMAVVEYLPCRPVPWLKFNVNMKILN